MSELNEMTLHPNLPNLIEIRHKESGATMAIDAGAWDMFKRLGYEMVEQISPPLPNPVQAIKDDPGTPIPASEGPEAEAALAAMKEG